MPAVTRITNHPTNGHQRPVRQRLRAACSPGLLRSIVTSDRMRNHTSAWAARWRLWLIGWAAWIGPGLLQAAQTVAMMSYAGRPLDWRPVVLSRLADWGTCGLFTPAFFWM